MEGVTGYLTRGTSVPFGFTMAASFSSCGARACSIENIWLFNLLALLAFSKNAVTSWNMYRDQICHKHVTEPKDPQFCRSN